MSCKQTDYASIESKQDIDVFLDRTNGLHDGYVIGVQYAHHGHTGGNPHQIDPTLSELTLRIMVTSIKDAVVELVFGELSEWQIKDCNASDIFGVTVSFSDNGNVVWADTYSTEPDVRKNGSFVVAKIMKWRFV